MSRARSRAGRSISRGRAAGSGSRPACTTPARRSCSDRRSKRGGGQSDGERVLDILAAHPSTATFIATKLARRFVADTPPPALVARAAARFRETRGDIREVLRTILTSPEFFAAGRVSREGEDAVRVRGVVAARDGDRCVGSGAAGPGGAPARDAALHVPASDRLRRSRRRVGQHGRAAEPHELRAATRRRTDARRPHRRGAGGSGPRRRNLTGDGCRRSPRRQTRNRSRR